MEKEIITKRVTFPIKPFKHIKIGDPMYFEELEKGENIKTLKKLTCDFDVKDVNVGAVQISTVESTHDWAPGEVFVNHEMKIILAADSEMLDTYLKGMWYGGETVSKKYELGCDTAQYDIEIDGRFDNVDTGCDGGYGVIYKMKKGYGLILTLWFDTLFSYEELLRRAKYWFEFIMDAEPVEEVFM